MGLTWLNSVKHQQKHISSDGIKMNNNPMLFGNWTRLLLLFDFLKLTILLRWSLSKISIDLMIIIIMPHSMAMKNGNRNAVDKWLPSSSFRLMAIISRAENLDNRWFLILSFFKWLTCQIKLKIIRKERIKFIFIFLNLFIPGFVYRIFQLIEK